MEDSNATFTSLVADTEKILRHYNEQIISEEYKKYLGEVDEFFNKIPTSDNNKKNSSNTIKIKYSSV